jgi:hypothetical protein
MVVPPRSGDFGHAAYPNQPWCIRGLEVGPRAGSVFGLVMMRFGIIAVVRCHYSVDALVHGVRDDPVRRPSTTS